MPRDRSPAFGRLAVVLAVQLAILAAIPFRQARARLAGEDVVLESMPVDPLDPLSGYYVALAWRAERDAGPWQGPGDGAWLVIRRNLPAWVGEACLGERPPPEPERIAIRAERVGDGCRIPSAQRFYIPEARRAEVEAAMRGTGRTALVDARVDAEGNVVLLRLRAGATVVGR